MRKALVRAALRLLHGYRIPRPAYRVPTSDPILPILAPLHPAVLADDHRRDGLAALNGRNVETVDAARNGGKIEDCAQRFERVVVGGDVLVESRLIADLRVSRREFEQTALLAAFGDQQTDPVPGRPR